MLPKRQKYLEAAFNALEYQSDATKLMAEKKPVYIHNYVRSETPEAKTFHPAYVYFYITPWPTTERCLYCVTLHEITLPLGGTNILPLA